MTRHLHVLAIICSISMFLAGVVARPWLLGTIQPFRQSDQPNPRATQFIETNKTYDIVLLGDSLTDHGRWGELFPELAVANRGIGRDTVAMAAARLNRLPPGPVYIMLGINDLLRQRPIPKIIDDYIGLLNGLEGRQIVVQSVVGPESLPVRELNEGLKLLANQRGVPFLDLSPALGHPLRDTYDTIHLTAPGYLKWARALRVHMAQHPTASSSEPQDRYGF